MEEETTSTTLGCKHPCQPRKIESWGERSGIQTIDSHVPAGEMRKERKNDMGLDVRQHLQWLKEDGKTGESGAEDIPARKETGLKEPSPAR